MASADVKLKVAKAAACAPPAVQVAARVELKPLCASEAREVLYWKQYALRHAGSLARIVACKPRVGALLERAARCSTAELGRIACAAPPVVEKVVAVKRAVVAHTVRAAASTAGGLISFAPELLDCACGSVHACGAAPLASVAAAASQAVCAPGGAVLLGGPVARAPALALGAPLAPVGALAAPVARIAAPVTAPVVSFAGPAIAPIAAPIAAAPAALPVVGPVVNGLLPGLAGALRIGLPR